MQIYNANLKEKLIPRARSQHAEQDSPSHQRVPDQH